MFIFEHGPTPTQKAWLERCSPEEQAAFVLSAPIHLYVNYAVLLGGRVEHRFVPSVHGILLGARVPHAEAADAMREGLKCQFGAVASSNACAVTVDVDTLGLRFETEQVTDLPAHDLLYFGRSLESVTLTARSILSVQAWHEWP